MDNEQIANAMVESLKIDNEQKQKEILSLQEEIRTLKQMNTKPEQSLNVRAAELNETMQVLYLSICLYICL